MSEYTSYFLYQKYEKRGDQDFMPCYPNVYSIDGDGTMPLVMKKEYDQAYGYTGGCNPQYDWVEIPIDEDYECDDCDLDIQTRWVDYTDAFTYFGDYKYGIQILETKVEDGEWTRTDQTKYTTNPLEKAERKIIIELSDGTKYSSRCGTSDGKYYNYPSEFDEWFYHESTDNSGLFENWKLCKTDLFEVGYDEVPCGGQPGRYCWRSVPNDTVLEPTEYGKTITSVTFGDCVTEIGDTHYCTDKIGFMIYPNLVSVTLPNSVEKIGTGVFANNTGLTTITFPDNLKKLGADEPAELPCNGSNGLQTNSYGTFMGCGLLNVNTNKIEEIGRRTFADNLNLTKITIGSACTRLDEAVFNNCPSLRQIIFEGSTVPECHKQYGIGNPVSSDVSWKLTDTDEYYDHEPEYLPPECKIYVPCDALTTFKNSPLTSGYTDIIYGYGGSCGDIPFIATDYKVKSLTYLDNGEPVTVRDLILDDTGTGNFTSVDRNTIYQMGISNIKSIEFGNCIRTIGDEAFYNVELTKVVLNNGLVSIGENAFFGFMGTELVIPDSVTTIGSWAFSRSSGVDPGVLRSLTIGTGLTSIPEGCFYRTAQYMTSLSIPDNIISIGEDAFDGCNNLSQLHIGSGITSIANNAFYQGYNTGFTDVTIEALIPPTISFTNFFRRSQINVHCSVVEDYIDEYKTHGSYSGTIDSIESECSGRTKTRWVESGTTCVGYDKYNQVAQEVSNDFGQTWRGNGVTSATTLIETDSRDCGYIPPLPEHWSFKVTYEDSTVTGSEYTGEMLSSGETRPLLDGYENTQGEIGSGITDIGVNCFYGMSGMTSIIIPEGVTYIGYNSFRFCSGLDSITIPSTVTRIDQYALSGLNNLASITVLATTPPYAYSNSFGSLLGGPIFVPAGSVNAYKAKSGWSTHANRIQAIPS